MRSFLLFSRKMKTHLILEYNFQSYWILYNYYFQKYKKGSKKKLKGFLSNLFSIAYAFSETTLRFYWQKRRYLLFSLDSFTPPINRWVWLLSVQKCSAHYYHSYDMVFIKFVKLHITTFQMSTVFNPVTVSIFEIEFKFWVGFMITLSLRCFSF